MAGYQKMINGFFDMYGQLFDFGPSGFSDKASAQDSMNDSAK